MKRTSPTNPPTIQELITSRIKQKNLSRSKFIRAVGYTKNISKGLRRFDNFLKTLEYPNDEFLRNILTVLEIDGLSFYQSFMVSKNVMAREADDKTREIFRPHIEVLISCIPTPFFAAQIIYAQLKVVVPNEIEALPILEELSAVISIYKKHVHSLICGNVARRNLIYGFRYHRKYNYFLEFDTDFSLKNIKTLHATKPEKIELGNKVIHLLAGHSQRGIY